MGPTISPRYFCRENRTVPNLNENEDERGFASSSLFFYAYRVTRETFTLPSFAKINLHLQVLGRRDDGYHELCTVFQTVSLHDDLTFSEANDLVLTCSDADTPADDSNLVLKAAHLLREKFGITRGARIHLEKRIPAPGGLGGGSSNAAVALLGLAKLWDVFVDPAELATLGRQLGADVPFFFYGGTALGRGRGDVIEPVADLENKHILIVTPDVQVSTREAFKGLCAPALTKETAKSILGDCRFDAESLNLRHSVLINDFEISIFRSHPEIGRVKERLIELGALQALMSGSGASVFAIFDTEETRQATLKAIENEHNWRQFAVAAISRDEYREALERVY
jgi:4-diphosphocytidyl-2-C-methyl-D-erythritol kinase